MKSNYYLVLGRTGTSCGKWMDKKFACLRKHQVNSWSVATTFRFFNNYVVGSKYHQCSCCISVGNANENSPAATADEGSKKANSNAILILVQLMWISWNLKLYAFSYFCDQKYRKESEKLLKLNFKQIVNIAWKTHRWNGLWVLEVADPNLEEHLTALAARWQSVGRKGKVKRKVNTKLQSFRRCKGLQVQ